MLVSAIGGLEVVMTAYRAAVERHYRFLQLRGRDAAQLIDRG